MKSFLSAKQCVAALGGGHPTCLFSGCVMTLDERLEKIEAILVVLVQRQQREWYSVEELAELVGRSVLTCREWCRHGRIIASKKSCDRRWVISHAEFLRYQREGLLPQR